MRIWTTAVALSVAIAFTGSALACGADKSAKVEQTKQQTASTQTVKTDTAKKAGS